MELEKSPLFFTICVYDRLLSASLHSEQVDSWIKVIDSREVLERVMWIAANTMNSLLLEKVCDIQLRNYTQWVSWFVSFVVALKTITLLLPNLLRRFDFLFFIWHQIFKRSL